MDRVRLYGYHGVDEQERTVGAYFVVSVRVTTEMGNAVEKDDLSGTVSYAELFDVVRDEMLVPSHLLEHVAGRIGHRILERFASVGKVHVEVMKENPPMSADCAGGGVAVEFVR